MKEVADTPRRPGRPAQISREQIVEAVATFDNIDTITMRQLAERLEVRHGALYRWVKSRDELFDLISEVVVDRVLSAVELDSSGWRAQLRQLALLIREHFLALPGYASHLSRPHVHNTHSVDRLRRACIDVFIKGGISHQHAEQSWLIFITSMISWLAVEEQPVTIGHVTPRFDLFLGVLLRGLPTQDSDVAA
ncbi:TetR/AcrR family transcriptional regulator [Streptomyces griseorubiginosus]|uniref:TetR family transcriptional regulator n=1 Tax=Streptomyces griseorubiginosus TaxID=67304 RepID=A0A117QXJ9_9ACTN|nr:TetR/AcrR family transcriptional regulator [Streptomyces griseorubiginosus]KUN59521.1 TetR family transcriptional regulator [Streptomyces griseorubiginosus]